MKRRTSQQMSMYPDFVLHRTGQKMDYTWQLGLRYRKFLSQTFGCDCERYREETSHFLDSARKCSYNQPHHYRGLCLVHHEPRCHPPSVLSALMISFIVCTRRASLLSSRSICSDSVLLRWSWNRNHSLRTFKMLQVDIISNHQEAYIPLGGYYRHGIGVERNYDTTVDCYKCAAYQRVLLAHLRTEELF